MTTERAGSSISTLAPEQGDWRVPVDMALVGLGYELDRIQTLLLAPPLHAV